MPSRDMIVREVTPPGSFGKVFGFVTTGFNIGGVVSPLIFGALMDHGAPARDLPHHRNMRAAVDLHRADAAGPAGVRRGGAEARLNAVVARSRSDEAISAQDAGEIASHSLAMTP